MTFIVKVGAHQYMVESGDVIEVEKLDLNEGDAVDLEVLLSFENGKINLQKSTLKGKVLNQIRDEKIRVVKYKPKSKYHKQRGHRQYKTLIQIQ